MPGFLPTFGDSDPLSASPTSSPMPYDERDLAPGQNYLEVFPTDSPFDGAWQGYLSPDACRVSYAAPTPGLGLTVEAASVQNRGVNPQDLHVASAAVEHPPNPAIAPLPMEILDSQPRAANKLTFTPSFIGLADGSSSAAADTQPLCIDPAVFADPFWSYTPRSSLLRDLYSAARRADCADDDTSAAPAADEVDAVDLDEQDFDSGSDTEDEETLIRAEDEETLMPSPTSTLNVPLPLPDDGKADGPRGTKRAADDEPERASKRRRSSSSSSADDDNDDDADFRPVPSTSTRRRGRTAARARTLQVDPGETEADARARTCAKCWTKFGRADERVRHDKESACGSATKRVCPVCHRRLGLRSDAFSRHLRGTRKCLDKQATMTREELEALGCLLEDGDKPKKGKGKKAKGKKAL